MAAPVKLSCCFLPWVQGSSSQPPPLTLDIGLLLSAASPDTGREVAPLGHASALPSQPMRFSATLGSIPMDKAIGGDGIPFELFQILKAVKVLHSICQHIWKTE